MRTVLAIVALTVVGLVGCGGGLKPTFAPAAPAPIPNLDTSANAPILKVMDIAGNYTIDSVEFDSDLPKDYPAPVLLTNTLQSVTIGVNGKPENIQARLDLAYLIIAPTGNFSFYYSIVNEQGKLLKVGSFQAGSMSGTIKTDVMNIGFVAGETNGLADEQEALYEVLHDATTLTLTDTDVSKNALTPHFSVVHAIKE